MLPRVAWWWCVDVIAWFMSEIISAVLQSVLHIMKGTVCTLHHGPVHLSPACSAAVLSALSVQGNWEGNHQCRKSHSAPERVWGMSYVQLLLCPVLRWWLMLICECVRSSCCTSPPPPGQGSAVSTLQPRQPGWSPNITHSRDMCGENYQ